MGGKTKVSGSATVDCWLIIISFRFAEQKPTWVLVGVSEIAKKYRQPLKSTKIIGRIPGEGRIRFHSKVLSREHCTLRIKNDKVFLTDHNVSFVFSLLSHRFQLIKFLFSSRPTVRMSIRSALGMRDGNSRMAISLGSESTPLNTIRMAHISFIASGESNALR